MSEIVTRHRDQYASDNLDKLLTPAEAAEYLQLSVKTLANQRVAGGGIPYLKLGRIRYRLADLQAHLERQLRTSTSDRGLVE